MEILFDGVKATRISDLPPSAWDSYSPGQGADEDDRRTYYQRIPWLNRGVNMRAAAVSTLPFVITKSGGDVVDQSSEYLNKVGFLPNPQRLIYLVEAALTVLGQAYLYRERNRVATTGLRYIVPTTVKPQLSPTVGLTGFVRRVGSQSYNWPTEDCIYFWLPDPFVELGPGNNSPVTAALNAAGVLHNVDKFAASFFERGAIKVTVLTIEGNPPPNERKRIKTWWNRVATGINRAFGAEVFNLKAVKPVVIGEGIRELSDNELTKEKREDIATALGIPQTKLWSSSAGGLGGGGVVNSDDLSFYRDTIVPESLFIASVLNEQIFNPLDLTWSFKPETLDVFQADENERSDAYFNYVNSKMPPSIAAQILGIELPAGVEPEDLDIAQQEEQDEQREARVTAAPEEKPPDNPRKAMWVDLRNWRKKALKKGTDCSFESEHIPDVLKAAIKAAIAMHGERAFDFVKGGQSQAEQRIRDKVAAVLKRFRRKYLDIILEGGTPDYAELTAALKAALGPEIASITTEAALQAAIETGVEFDPAAVNAEAAEWARTYTFELVTGLTKTTRDVVSRAMQQYVETPGMTRGQLEELLQHGFNEYRASMIAVTETTRAYAQAFNQYQRMIKEEAGIEMERIWNTNADESVCPVCGPFNQKPESIWAGEFPNGPPAHVNCRCFLTLRYNR